MISQPSGSSRTGGVGRRKWRSPARKSFCVPGSSAVREQNRASQNRPDPRLRPPERSRSWASLTVRARPSRSVPFSACIAREASAFDISTNPKPRGRPVSRSLINETFSTAPCLANSSRTISSVAVKGRFPTYSFVTERSYLVYRMRGRRQPPAQLIVLKYHVDRAR